MEEEPIAERRPFLQTAVKLRKILTSMQAPGDDILAERAF